MGDKKETTLLPIKEKEMIIVRQIPKKIGIQREIIGAHLHGYDNLNLGKEIKETIRELSELERGLMNELRGNDELYEFYKIERGFLLHYMGDTLNFDNLEEFVEKNCSS